jgi:peptidylprolyl isomerase
MLTPHPPPSLHSRAGWDEGFATMRKGEKAFLVCGPAFAYGPGGSPPKIPANATLRFEVELLSFGPKPKEPWQMSNEEKLNVAEAAKAEGNAAFSAGGREADALEHYKRGLACLEQADDVDGKVHTLRVTFHSNSAAVHLRLQAYADAAKSASAALKLDASHPKSLFRRGTAHTKLGNFAEAKADLGEALRLSPGDAGVKAELAKLAEAVKAERAREKAAFGGIFSK